jgi:hypothetical protein
MKLRFTRSYTFGRTPWAGDQLVARPLPVHKDRKTHIETPNIHALSGIRTQDPGFRVSEDSACLRPLGYRDGQNAIYNMEILCKAMNTQRTLQEIFWFCK